MTDRWTLDRAGIVNVFQYDDEVLHFADGRLLLRGVNGSGKSTAMNMLLPFLLEADVRRIDAAGEQQGVLRSWMLSGRDEPQPVGYLWIEFRRNGDDGEHHLVCGCGIKANRSTDRVTTWWFLTDRRPGVDLSLVTGRHPLSTDALRAELGATAVFTHEQRGSYREAVRQQLYGGAELDRHLRLLHEVRSPRVGDRISNDLTGYLLDALPQLSDRAIDDAAQPLENLEEFRRNVEQLTRTAATLDALSETYRSYVRGELRRRAESLRGLARSATQASRAAAEAEQDAERARAAAQEAQHRSQQLDQDRVQAESALRALLDREEYKEGQRLDDLRQRVADLHASVDGTEQALRHAVAAERRTIEVLHRAWRDADTRQRQLAEVVQELSSLATLAGVSTAALLAPALVVGREGTEEIHPAGDRPDAEALRDAVGRTRSAVLVRGAEVTELRHLIDAAATANRALEDAARSAATAAEQVAEVAADLSTADASRAAAADDWQRSIQEWTTRLRRLLAEAGIDTGALDKVAAGPAALDPDGRRELTAALRAISDTLLDHHRRRVLSLESELQQLADAIARVEQELEELADRAHPDPPVAPWQRRGSAWQLADLVDFAEDLTDDERTGLESAMEAAGLLGAELPNDLARVAQHTTILVDGQVVTLATGAVTAPLSDLLVVALPDSSDERCAMLGPPPDAAAVRAVLDSIGTDRGPAAAAEDVSGGPLAAVGTDGSFRMGTLAGRWHKERAEHIGVSARRAAIERLRGELTRQLTELHDQRHGATQRRDRAESDRITAAHHHEHVPSEVALVGAEARCTALREQLDRAEQLHAERLSRLRLAEAEASASEERVQRTSTELSLPRTAEQLTELTEQLRRTTDASDRVDRAVKELDDGWSRWCDATEQWSTAEMASGEAAERLDAARRRHDPVAMELASLEDAVGARYDEVLSAIDATRDRLGSLAAEIPAALDRHVQLEKAVATADNVAAHRHDAARAAASTAAAAVAPVAETIQLPGLWSSATDADPPPAVATDTAGAAAMAEAVLAKVPPPDRLHVTADGVRQTLRNQRDRLSAGWDAEEHQPDERMPWVIEVTGPDVAARAPLATATEQVHATLSRQNGLLTAQQDQALQNLLQGLIAKEVAAKMQSADELIQLMQRRLSGVTTSHGVGASLRWRRRRDVDPSLSEMVDLLSVEHDLRTTEQERALMDALSVRIATARAEDPEASYRQLISEVLDYRSWFDLDVLVQRPGEAPKLLSRRSALSEGEKKIVSYLPLFAAVAASCDALATDAPRAPRFVLLDDAFAKVSEDNHARLFGLLVELDLDFIATSERLWGTHSSVPQLAITEVLRDADLGVIALEHFTWNGHERTAG